MREGLASTHEAVITERLWSTYCVHLALHGVEGRVCAPRDLLHLARLFVLSQAASPVRFGKGAADGSG